MIKPDMIPDEVVKAASREYELYIYDAVSADGIRLAIAAALNAWPGLKLENLCGWVMDGPDLPYVEETASIILPLPQENVQNAGR